VSEYLVELYVSRADACAIERDAERVRQAAEEQTRRGIPVRFLRSIFVPDDETCFLLIEASSAEAVRDAAELAALPYERVTAVAATT
jgi:hypothetical protein